MVGLVDAFDPAVIIDRLVSSSTHLTDRMYAHARNKAAFAKR